MEVIDCGSCGVQYQELIDRERACNSAYASKRRNAGGY